MRGAPQASCGQPALSLREPLIFPPLLSQGRAPPSPPRGRRALRHRRLFLHGEEGGARIAPLGRERSCPGWGWAWDSWPAGRRRRRCRCWGTATASFSGGVVEGSVTCALLHFQATTTRTRLQFCAVRVGPRALIVIIPSGGTLRVIRGHCSGRYHHRKRQRNHHQQQPLH